MPMRLMLLAALALACTTPMRARAEQTLRIGKPEAAAFDFIAVEIASENGIFARYGIAAESIGFGGAAAGRPEVNETGNRCVTKSYV